MTITMTTGELYEFQSNLSLWYLQRSEYILSNLTGSPLHFGADPDMTNQIKRHADRFEKNNPRPDWKSLL